MTDIETLNRLLGGTTRTPYDRNTGEEVTTTITYRAPTEQERAALVNQIAVIEEQRITRAALARAEGKVVKEPGRKSW